jgi:hypothetical protein
VAILRRTSPTMVVSPLKLLQITIRQFPRARTAHARGFSFQFFEVRIRSTSLFHCTDLGQLNWVQLPTRRRNQSAIVGKIATAKMHRFEIEPQGPSHDS